MAVDSTVASPSKLGLGGTTINAMALIAPGAFLWTTYALQAQAKVGDTSSAPSMWSGLVLAIILCFLTAIAYAELAKLYPGPGSSYLFAEQSFLNHEISRPGARVAKFLVGWASHIYYWIYPAVMVAMMGALCGYIIGSLTGGPSGNVHTQLWDPTSPPGWVMALVAVIFTFAVTLICIRGVQGSTKINIAINVIQITALVIVSIMFFIFRSKHPDSVMHYVHPALTSVLIPHGLGQVISQAALAILLLVGFESVTSLGDEVHNPNRTIPLAVLLSLAIQGLFCYLLEYFAANLVINNAAKFTDAAHKVPNPLH
nr:APC family permease [Armatimonadota bacterium]